MKFNFHSQKGYEFVVWPDTQRYMGENWFNAEALLLNSEEEVIQFGSAAFWIPRERIQELRRKIYR